MAPFENPFSRDRSRADRVKDGVRILLVGVGVILVAVSVSVLAAAALLGSAVVLAIIQTAPESFRGQEMFFGAITFVVVAVLTGGDSARMAFYVASAQVIPVLFVALAVESRFGLIGSVEVDQRATLVTALALGIGGFETLRVLAQGHADTQSFSIVAGSLAAAAVSLILSALARPGPAAGNE